MNEIFGVPMTTIVTALVALLAVCLLFLLWIALRRPMMFKIGARNIPKRPAQTVLIIIGLMLSTLIIAASLGTGDTIDYSLTSATYEQLGEADHLVVYSGSGDGEGSISSSLADTIPQSTVAEVEAVASGTDLIDGVGPILIEQMPVVLLGPDVAPDELTIDALDDPGVLVQAEPVVNVIGLDPSTVPELGGMKTPAGVAIDVSALGENQAIISEELADDLGAVAGDNLGFTFDNIPYVVTVMEVAENTALSGYFEQNVPGMTLRLDRLQEITGQPDTITAVAVSAKGGVRDSLQYSDQVTTLLQDAFAGQAIGIDPLKADNVELAETFASVFSLFFLVFGLFSIGVGILLILLIFSMLAAERRPEMGMARAVGAQRAQLVQQFVAEGSIYALLAGLLGVVLGAGAAYLIGYAFQPLFGDFFDITPHVTGRSMLAAYALGVVITLIAVLFSSMRISRLNIVAAIRDIPDVSSPKRSLRTLFWAIVMLVIGGFAMLAGFSGDAAFPAYLGMSLTTFGVAQVARFVGLPSRLVYTIAGLVILSLWLMPIDWEQRLFGELDGDVEMFFLSGIFMVAGATLVIVQNLDVFLALLTSIGGVFKSALPSIKTAVAFPSANPSRTGMTVAMFSLITFSLVVFAAFNENFSQIFLGDDANAGWDIRADQGLANPIGDQDEFLQALEDGGVDTNQFEAVGIGNTWFQAYLRQHDDQEWMNYIVHGIDDELISESQLFFQQRAEGYTTDADIINALLTEPGTAVIDVSALTSDPFGGAENQFVVTDPDGEGEQKNLDPDDEIFPAFVVQVQNQDGGQTPLRIIGVIDSRVGSFFGLFTGKENLSDTLSNPPLTSYFVRLTDPENATEVAQEIESALLLQGVEATSVVDELEEGQEQSQAFLYIMQGFMGLGLIVGLAAVGVIAFRSVVERRQQIGVMRAIGFQSRDVSLSFLIEQAFVVALGSLSGAVLGVLLAMKLFADEEFAPEGFDFVVPWEWVIGILVVTVIAALLMTFVPARQASKLAPAEALRYE